MELRTCYEYQRATVASTARGRYTSRGVVEKPVSARNDSRKKEKEMTKNVPKTIAKGKKKSRAVETPKKETRHRITRLHWSVSISAVWGYAGASNRTPKKAAD